MNKAFMREPDAAGEFCPKCGSLGLPVQRETIAAQLLPGMEAQLAITANFCPHPTCEVAYFDMFERTIPAAALRKPVYPKDPDAPICACFGFTCAEIDQDLAEGVVARTKAHLERAKSHPSDCERLAANGRSCVAEIQRYYMQHRR
ncbi:MAG: hypothetical protein AB7F89_17255 [Pirellulaceae bacterium]